MAKKASAKIAKSTKTAPVVEEKAKRSYSCKICSGPHQARSCDYDFVSGLPADESLAGLFSDIRAGNFSEPVMALLKACWGIYEQRQAASKVRKSTKGAARQCKLCGEYGHNAATCKSGKAQRDFQSFGRALYTARILGLTDDIGASKAMLEAVGSKVLSMDDALSLMAQRDMHDGPQSEYTSQLDKAASDFAKASKAFDAWKAKQKKVKKTSKKSKK